MKFELDFTHTMLILFWQYKIDRMLELTIPAHEIDMEKLEL